ncbi:protein FAR1-RELATED SEQUENCE 5-like [Salvia divinorum]|uniref:Protein FAR1-RELATED SEQUENCE 5-like n=1 Tax=Salvia divinorum TaxID=28513 RepID=A0ABD1FX78_SALDI
MINNVMRKPRNCGVEISCSISMDVNAALDCGNGLMEASIAGDVTTCEAERNAEPYVEGDCSFVSRGFGCRNILTSQKSGNMSNEGGQKQRRDGCTATLS